MIHSAYENEIWTRLIRRLGGVRAVALHVGRREQQVCRWRTGEQNCPPKMLEALIRLCEDHSELERLQDELRVWHAAAVERREALRLARRARFVERFGHEPDDKNWQAYKHRGAKPAEPGKESFTPTTKRRVLPF